MQYLLTHEEMEAVRGDREILRNLPGGVNHMEGLKNVCQHVATQMAEVGGNLPNGRKPSDRPHGCVYVRDGSGNLTAHYCDNCPVSGLCPLPKEWSK